MNVFARTCLAVETDALGILHGGGSNERWSHEMGEAGEYRVWEVERFSNADGLLADPTPYERNPGSWPEPLQLDAKALTERFRDHYLLIDDETAYRARFAPKASLVDAEHFGNFHQQLGQELMLVRRESPPDWWVSQKFTDDLDAVQDTLYRAVQESSLKKYFRDRFSQGHTVVDLGCGTGYYTNLIASYGASVLGVDPSGKYIELARKHASSGVRFEHLPIGEPGGLDGVGDGSADFVFMSDALLFYFVPMAPDQRPDAQVLLADVRRILKPGGMFISVEPHYLFWLLPWLGDVERPFTVMTEYLRKCFGVTPCISRFIQTLATGGFAVTWMEELTPDPAFERTDSRAYHFARQFPLWHLVECKPVAGD